MKTIEEKRAAVLAYCEQVCPKIGDVWQDDLMGISIEHCEYTEGKSVFEFNVLGKSIIFRRDRNVFTDQINQFHYLAYRLLSLETSDAVDELNDMMQRRDAVYKELEGNHAKSLKHGCRELDLERARNAALVAALEEIAAEKSAIDADDRQISIDTLSVHWSAVHRIASEAIEANKKEGVQG